MIEKVPVTEARATLSELVNRVGYAGDHVLLTRHGKAVAALVSMAEYERVLAAGAAAAAEREDDEA